MQTYTHTWQTSYSQIQHIQAEKQAKNEKKKEAERERRRQLQEEKDRKKAEEESAKKLEGDRARAQEIEEERKQKEKIRVRCLCAVIFPTAIPTIIDPVALGYFIVALGSIIVGISVCTETYLYVAYVERLNR